MDSSSVLSFLWRSITAFRKSPNQLLRSRNHRYETANSGTWRARMLQLFSQAQTKWSMAWGQQQESCFVLKPSLKNNSFLAFKKRQFIQDSWAENKPHCTVFKMCVSGSVHDDKKACYLVGFRVAQCSCEFFCIALARTCYLAYNIQGPNKWWSKTRVAWLNLIVVGVG